jgi:hypothetical protein
MKGADRGAGDGPEPDLPRHTEQSQRVTEASNTRAEADRQIIRQAFDAWQNGPGVISDMFAPPYGRRGSHLMAAMSKGSATN